MSLLGHKMGAQHDTFMGLAGLGDLVLTCTDNQSRNRRFGLNLGQGMSIDEAETSIGQVVEGKHNAKHVDSLAEKYQVDMPICREVYRIIKAEVKPLDAVDHLMGRPPKDESED